ncbi:hypothetical protein LCGC14_1714930 [marine sediment metagenome]|uniref:Uncharacterized protein n=1 Tax=marine sediment metagenome TaxID=412755 RepID=A0A0F9KE68_9ZZZZ
MYKGGVIMINHSRQGITSKLHVVTFNPADTNNYSQFHGSRKVKA